MLVLVNTVGSSDFHADRTPDSDDAFDRLLRRAAHLTTLPVQHRAPSEVRVGSELCDGRYKVTRWLGGGGMGVVFEAMDCEREVRVAIKTLSRMDAVGIYRLKNEFRALAGVVHPNLVQLHELVAVGDLWLLSMELVDGVHFDRWVRPANELDDLRLVPACRQLLAGVRAIHDAGKLHCDLKPSNVLVRSDGGVVVLDFGLVTDCEPGGVGHTVTGSQFVGGTPSYMAPEQAAGAELGPPADLYAFGVVLFEALTGRLPFVGPNKVVLAAKQHQPAPLVRSLRSDVPDDLADLCDGLLLIRPEDRPDAREVAKLFGEEPRRRTSTPPPAVSRPPSAFVGRSRELATLEWALQKTLAGACRVVRVTGDAGLGKTALIDAWLRRLDAPTVVLRGRCFDREHLPYNAFDEVIDQLTRHLRRLPPVETSACLPRDIRALARIFPVLERLEAVAAAPLRSHGEQQDERQIAFAALGELFDRVRDRWPLVVAIDDFQSRDEDSQTLMRFLLTRPEPTPWLLVLGGPSGSELGVPASAPVEVIDLVLEPLSEESSIELASTLLEGLGSDSTLERDVAREARGSPLLIAELAYHLEDRDGSARAVTLEDIVHARLGALRAPAQQLLNCIALAPQPVPHDVAARAVQAPGGAHLPLESLREARLIRGGIEHGYECHHLRIREILRMRLGTEEQQACRHRLAQAWSERADVDPDLLFHLYRQGGAPESALRYGRLAASLSMDNMAFERAADLYGHLADMRPEEADLHRARALALSRAGRFADAAESFAAGRDRALAAEQRSYLDHEAAVHFLASGRGREGLRRFERTVIAAGLSWPRAAVTALLIAFCHLVLLRLTGARYGLRARLDEVSPLRDPEAYGDGKRGDPNAMRLDVLLTGAALVPIYDLPRGLYFMTAFARSALRSGEPARSAVALGIVCTLMAKFPFSRAFARRTEARCTALARKVRPLNLGSAALTYVAFARLGAGELEPARALAAEAEERLVHLGQAHVYEIWVARTIQGFALVLMGRVLEAKRQFAQNAADAETLRDDLAAAGGQSVFGHLMDDDLEGARALLDRKVAALDRLDRYGVLHATVWTEHRLLALYTGEAAPSSGVPPPTWLSPTWLDPQTLSAGLSLQALARGEVEHRHRAAVRSAVRRLARGPGLAQVAMSQQYSAALALLSGDRRRAARHLEQAADCYQRVGMQLHVCLVGRHLGRIRPAHGDGSVLFDETMRAQRVRDPAALLRMLTPGFEGLDLSGDEGGRD